MSATYTEPQLSPQSSVLSPQSEPDCPVVVRGRSKKYGDLRAVNDVSFSVRRGEVFGLLGPNGAGKTSTVEIIEGLRPAENRVAHHPLHRGSRKTLRPDRHY